MTVVNLNEAWSIVDGALLLRGENFEPEMMDGGSWGENGWRRLSRIKGIGGAMIEPFRITHAITVRRISMNGQKWWEPAPPQSAADFIGPAKARKIIAEQDAEREVTQ